MKTTERNAAATLNLIASIYIGGTLSNDCFTTTKAMPHIIVVHIMANEADNLSRFSFFMPVFYHNGLFFASKTAELS